MIRLTPYTLLLVTIGLLACAPRMAHAAESYDNCSGFITSLPAVITTQGTWCLKQDLATAINSGSAITINTNNVTIDCNDFKIGGLAAGAGTQTIGLDSSDRTNITVRHCNIRGFFRGIRFASTGVGGSHLVEDNRFDGNTYLGMNVSGDGSVVRRNRVFNTGGSTVNLFAYGIYTAYSVDVLDNSVSGVIATAGGNGAAQGIHVVLNPTGSISGNHVRGLAKDGTGAGTGIYAISSGRITVRDNDLIGDGATGAGVSCDDPNGSASGNVISGFFSGIAICTDDGANVITP